MKSLLSDKGMPALKVRNPALHKQAAEEDK
jgi:hypothetical protein